MKQERTIFLSDCLRNYFGGMPYSEELRSINSAEAWRSTPAMSKRYCYAPAYTAYIDISLAITDIYKE